MAEEQKDDIEIKPAKSKKKLVLIIAVIVLVLVGAGAAFFLMGDDTANDDATTESAEAPKAAPIYYEVSDPLIINFAQQSNNAVRYLQVKMKVMAREQQVIDAFALHEPAIIHELLLLFYSQNYDELSTTEGTRALQDATLTTINQQLTTLTGNVTQLEAVYFTSLVMQ
ncbi:flagellar basal body-associated FliL family protein [Methylophaga sp. OBS3]|uniref:flagellar basal body-associated FliL family protein n=1 Tax=Methylophaga sp. OBS3 TaxID=2991934 RepID=UPI00225178D6|nr:flagellar basal body-associated FliL family protein [Methylophaga sp. OBS3]MCX4188699.1 flagellar basal body-associated FliL family protein [Methylophaga sp. OBS3]